MEDHLTQSLNAAQLCVVCAKLANGHFFGAMVCLPCKSFFIRCTKDGEPHILQQCNGSCDIRNDLRHRCQFCRYQQCLAVGMSRKEKPEYIEPLDGQELCKVCGDLANGIHFGVDTCEGCKKFFRRGLKEHESYVCKGQHVCELNPRNRNNCRYCRYLKCVKVGMSREAIKMGRPRKIGKKSCINDAVKIVDTSMTSLNDHSINNTERSASESCDDESRERIDKCVSGQGLCYQGHCDNRTSGTWTQEGILQSRNCLKRSSESKGLQVRRTTLNKPLNTQEHCEYLQYHRRGDTGFDQGSCAETSSGQLLQSLNRQTSLADNASMQGTSTHNSPPEVNMCKSELPSYCTPERRINRVSELSKCNTHQRPNSDASVCAVTSRSIKCAQVQGMYAGDIIDRCIVQGPSFNTTNVLHNIPDRSNDAVNVADVRHFDESVPGNSQVLHSRVENNARQLSRPRVHDTSSLDKFLSSRRSQLAMTSGINYGCSGVTTYSSSPEHLLPWRQSLSGGLRHTSEEFNQSSKKRFFEKHDNLADDRNCKSARYDDMILDLSVHARPRSTAGKSNGETSKSVYNGCLNKYLFYDSHCGQTMTTKPRDIHLREASNQRFAHTAPPQSCSGNLHFSSRDVTQSLDMSRNVSTISSASSSCESKIIRSFTGVEADSLDSFSFQDEVEKNSTKLERIDYQGTQTLEISRNCSQKWVSSSYRNEKVSGLESLKFDGKGSSILQEEITNNCVDAERDIYHRPESLMDETTEMFTTSKRHTINAKISINDRKKHEHLIESHRESRVMKCATDCKASLCTPCITETLTHSRNLLSPSSCTARTIYDDNSTDVKLSTPKSTSILFSAALSTSKDSPSIGSSIRDKCTLSRSRLLSAPRMPQSTAQDMHDIAQKQHSTNSYCPEQEINERNHYTFIKEQSIMYTNEMFMVVDTLTDTIYNSARRISAENISTELEAIDNIFTSVYGYSPLQVTQFWKSLYLSMPCVSPDKWHTIITPALLGWLSHITNIYTEKVESYNEDINGANTNMLDMLQLEEEEGNSDRHFQSCLARWTSIEAHFVLKIPDIHKIDTKDLEQLGNSTHLYGNIILMASREWFDPVRKRFKHLWNWKLPNEHPLNSYHNHIIRTGSRIYNLHMDRTEVAILSALNIMATENNTFQNLTQIAGHTQTLLRILCYYHCTINVDPEDRVPELLSVMPKVRLMTMWYSNLIKNMTTEPSSTDKARKDLTVMATKMSSGNKEGS